MDEDAAELKLHAAEELEHAMIMQTRSITWAARRPLFPSP